MYNSQETIFRIKQRAKEQGIAILDLQTKCDLGRNAISQAAKSQDGMKARNLFTIAEVLDCSVDYLLGRTDNPTVLSESYIGGDNNGIQAIKNRGSVTIRQTAEKENNCKEIEVLLEKMPRSKQLRAIADIIDLLEEKYQEE